MKTVNKIQCFTNIAFHSRNKQKTAANAFKAIAALKNKDDITMFSLPATFSYMFGFFQTKFC